MIYMQHKRSRHIFVRFISYLTLRKTNWYLHCTNSVNIISIAQEIALNYRRVKVVVEAIVRHNFMSTINNRFINKCRWQIPDVCIDNFRLSICLCTLIDSYVKTVYRYIHENVSCEKTAMNYIHKEH